MARQRHYRNLAEGGAIVFVTTTVLDFVPVFRDEGIAGQMEALLFEIHAHFGATLDAYVIMPEHLHWVCRLPENLSTAQFVGRLKSFAAKALRPQLTAGVQARFSYQAGLNRRQFWQRSFRSIEVKIDKVFWQKVNYIHENPVRRGLVGLPEEYRWSSATAFLSGQWSEDHGLCHWRRVIKVSRPAIASTGGPAEASRTSEFLK